MRLSYIIVFFLITTIGFSQPKPKIGLVLSGGGAKGLAHIGVLKELEKKGIKPDYIIGTSTGALIGGLYALGFSADELESIVLEQDWDFLINDEILRDNVLIGQERKNKKSIIHLKLDGLKPVLPTGLVDGHNILTLLNILSRNYNYDINFDSLPIPFRCVATNIETGEEKIFSHGKLAEALRASMSIPSIFSPFVIENQLYVDGGLVNNFPADIAKEMGADIIIGVDVSAGLYKKEEINSIIKILDQSTSLYNAKISRINRKLCDLYIRPDISELTAMDFSEVKQIIRKGSDATQNVSDKIDSLIQIYPQMINPTQKCELSNTINIQSVFIKSSESKRFRDKAINRLIHGKLKFKLPCVITENELSERINLLYGSQYFDNVNMEFEQVDSSYILKLFIKEKRDNNFNIGARYDQEYGLNLLLRAELRNLMIYGSLLELSTVIGESPQIKIRYTTDRGNSIGFGSSISYDLFKYYTYANNKIFSSYNFRRSVWDLFIHSNIGKYNRLVLGSEVSLFALTSNQSISDLKDIKNANVNIFASYTADTWDKAYYPKKGLRINVRADLIRASSSALYSQGWMRANNVFSISSKIKLITEGFVGIASKGVDTSIYRFNIGGIANNRIQWYSSFPGLRFLEKGSSNIWILKASPRYQFFKNNYLTFTFAVAALDKNSINLFTDAEQFYTGVGLKYGLDGLFGPLEISIDYAFQTYQNHYFISLGYWF